MGFPLAGESREDDEFSRIAVGGKGAARMRAAPLPVQGTSARPLLCASARRPLPGGARATCARFRENLAIRWCTGGKKSSVPRHLRYARGLR